jgi:nucleotide-binding universal stress UspA family protein
MLFVVGISETREDTMFKRILVAVDGSDVAELALEESIKLARALQSQLRLVYVVDAINISLGADFPYPVEMSKAIIKSGQALLHKAGAAASKAGIPVETRLIEIDILGQRIPELIAADAEAWPADMIVIGTHGRRGLSHLFLGSVAEGVVRVATKPVLLIRGE